MSNKEKFAVVTSLAIFLPLPMAVGVILLFTSILMLKGEAKKYFKKVPANKLILAFIVMEMIVSALNLNFMGIGSGIWLLMTFLYIGYFRENITRKSFKIMTGLFIGLSITVAYIGFVQYLGICERLEIPWQSFSVQEKPRDRICSIYINANLYATICEIVILLCLHRYVESPHLYSRVYYVAVAILNLMMIYLTGCRTAFLPFLLVFPVYFYLRKKKGLLLLAIGGEMVALILVAMFPFLLPRMGGFSTFTSRLKIWSSSLEMIRDHFLFGCGTETYGLLKDLYQAHNAPHCHNILLDAICSYGAVGFSMILGYCQKMWHEWKKSALSIGLLIIILVHGILDCTILYPLIMLLCLIIWNAGGLVSEEKG